jgi:D-amino-acid dehydrogenase
MKIVVIGGGLLGVTTAYFLARNGHRVTVLDREDGPGRGTSFANATLLTPSMTEPWNAPGSWRALLASLVGSHTAIQVRLGTLPGLGRWGLAFLRNSRARAFERNTLVNLGLALRSLEVMQSLREEANIEYGRSARGILSLFRDRASLDQATEALRRRSEHRLCFSVLSGIETATLEPALTPIANHLAGAIHCKTDESGDPYRFCVALTERAKQQGVEFRFRTEVLSLEVRSRHVAAATAERERFVADAYVVAAGSYSTALLRRAGIQIPVRPVKGYSVTIDHVGQQSLTIPVIDNRLHGVVAPLEGAVRVTGIAEFAGFDQTLDPDRIRKVLRLLEAVLPQLQFNPATAKPWCGLRPMSADGVPIIGPTSISNLFVNTGHGPLGWTMAAGSGSLLAGIISGDVTAIDPAPFRLARFGSAR